VRFVNNPQPPPYWFYRGFSTFRHFPAVLDFPHIYQLYSPFGTVLWENQGVTREGITDRNGQKVTKTDGINHLRRGERDSSQRGFLPKNQGERGAVCAEVQHSWGEREDYAQRGFSQRTREREDHFAQRFPLNQGEKGPLCAEVSPKDGYTTGCTMVGVQW